MTPPAENEKPTPPRPSEVIRFRRLLDSIPYDAAVFLADGRVHSATRSFRRHWLGGGQEVPVESNTTTGDVDWRSVLDAALAGHPSKFETVRTAADGETRHYRISAMPCGGRKAHGCYVVAEDITPEMRAQIDAEAGRHEVVRRMASHVAHRLNGSMMVLIGYADLAARRLAAEGHAPVEELKEISFATEALASFSRRLQLIAGATREKAELLGLDDLILAWQAELQALAGDRGRLHFELASTSERVRAIPALLREGLRLMLQHALEHTRGDLRMTIATSVRYVGERLIVDHPALRAGRWVVLTVEFNGDIALPANGAEMFDPPDPMSTLRGADPFRGPELKAIARRHDAVVVVESNPGEGQRLDWYFPIAQPGAAEPAGGEFVLLIENLDRERQMLAGLLREVGVSVLEVPSVAEARRLVGALPTVPSAVVAACEVGVEELAALHADLRERRGDQALVVLAGDSQPAVAETVRAAGGVLLVRPVTAWLLREALRLAGWTSSADGRNTPA